MIKDRGRQAGERLGWLKPRWCTAALTNYHEQEKTSQSESNACSETLQDLLPISLPTSLLSYSSKNACGIARSNKTQDKPISVCLSLCRCLQTASCVPSSFVLNFLIWLVKKTIWGAIFGVSFIYRVSVFETILRRTLIWLIVITIFVGTITIGGPWPLLRISSIHFYTQVLFSSF